MRGANPCKKARQGFIVAITQIFSKKELFI